MIDRSLVTVRICIPDYAKKGKLRCWPSGGIGSEGAVAKHAGTVTSSGGVIHCPGSCSLLTKGTSIKLTAAPTRDASIGQYRFDRWEGSCTGKLLDCQVSVTSKIPAPASAVFVSDSS